MEIQNDLLLKLESYKVIPLHNIFITIVLDYLMRKVHNGRKYIGFQLKRGRSRRVVSIVISDLDFADDIALLTEDMIRPI